MSTISVGPVHFAAGHRILGLRGEGEKCRNLHGHTFGATWTLQQDDDLEFGTLKKALKEMVKFHFDHTFFVDKTDDLINYLQVNHLKVFPLDGPPTTERIVKTLAHMTQERFTAPGWNHWGQRPQEPSKGDEPNPLYPNAVLLSVALTEGPENTATWQNPAVKPYAAGGLVSGISGVTPSTTYLTQTSGSL